MWASSSQTNPPCSDGQYAMNVVANSKKARTMSVLCKRMVDIRSEKISCKDRWLKPSELVHPHAADSINRLICTPVGVDCLHPGNVMAANNIDARIRSIENELFR